MTLNNKYVVVYAIINRTDSSLIKSLNLTQLIKLFTNIIYTTHYFLLYTSFGMSLNEIEKNSTPSDAENIVAIDIIK